MEDGGGIGPVISGATHPVFPLEKAATFVVVPATSNEAEPSVVIPGNPVYHEVERRLVTDKGAPTAVGGTRINVLDRRARCSQQIELLLHQR